MVLGPENERPAMLSIKVSCMMYKEPFDIKVRERGKLRDLKKQLRKSLFPGGEVAIVVGARRLGRRDNDTPLAELGITNGSVIQVQPRSLVSSRRYVEENSETEEEEAFLNSEEIHALREFLSNTSGSTAPKGGKTQPNKDSPPLRRVQSESQPRGPVRPRKEPAPAAVKKPEEDQVMRQNMKKLRDQMTRAKEKREEKKEEGRPPPNLFPPVLRSQSAPCLGMTKEYCTDTLDELSDNSTTWVDETPPSPSSSSFQTCQLDSKTTRLSLHGTDLTQTSRSQSSSESTMGDSRESVGGEGLTDRCEKCRRRLKISNSFMCRCGNSYCTSHRLPESHHCQHDYKIAGREKIERENPKMGGFKKPIL